MRFIRSLIGAVLAVGAFTTFTSSANAGIEAFCTYGFPAQGACNPSQFDHSYRGIAALGGGSQDHFWKCAGATLDNSSTPYGSYFCANDYGCHSYSGDRILRPKIKNGSTPQVLTGRGAYGVDYFDGCNHATAQAMALTDEKEFVGAARTALPVLRGPTGAAPPSGTLKKTFGVEVPDGGSVSFKTPSGSNAGSFWTGRPNVCAWCCRTRSATAWRASVASRPSPPGLMARSRVTDSRLGSASNPKPTVSPLGRCRPQRR